MNTSRNFGIAVVGIAVLVAVYFVVKKSPVDTPPVVVTVPITTGSSENVFTDQTQTIRFSYPKELSVTPSDAELTTSWRTNTQTLGRILAKVVLPKTSQPNTNLSDSWVTIGTSSDPQASKDCLVPTNGERAKGVVTINGVVFNRITLTDAGMSQYYDTTSYHTLRNGHCYVIEYTIHSVSIGVYSPDQGIKEFDTKKVVDILEGMVQSVVFLK